MFQDIRTAYEFGGVLIWGACRLGGHFRVANWLFEIGAAADIRTADASGKTPMNVAGTPKFRISIVKWLIFQGASKKTNSHGHVNQDTILRNGRPRPRRRLVRRASLQLTINEHAAFIIMLTAARFAADVAQEGS